MDSLPPLAHRARVALPDIAAVVAVAASVVLAAYWVVVSYETYMRLALGRVVVTGDMGSSVDPWLLPSLATGWHDPEWLGDALLFTMHRLAKETGLVTLKILVMCGGWLLLYTVARRRGGSPVVIAALVAIVLAGAESRLTERNEMHVYWLAPAYLLVLEAARRDPRRLWGLVPLGLLWANLHPSFVIGWLLVGAAMADAFLGEVPDRRRGVALAVALGLQVLLPLATPGVVRTYAFLWNHHRNDEMIRATFYEFSPPDSVPATAAGLPLHVLSLLGLASFLPRQNRRNVRGFLEFLPGLLMAQAAIRFLPVFGLMAVATVAANLAHANPAPLQGRRWLRAVAAALLAAGSVVLLFPAVRKARAATPVTQRPRDTWPAARWLQQHVGPDDRLFNPYSGSQWLMWEAPSAKLYVHAASNFENDLVTRYFRHVLKAPEHFEAEVRKHGINLALVSHVDETGNLIPYLFQAPDWKLVYWDGTFSVLARDEPKSRRLIQRFRYRIVRPVVSFEYLADVPDEEIADEIERLRIEAPPVYEAIVGYRLLVRAPGGETPVAMRARLERARDLLENAGVDLLAPAVTEYAVRASLGLGDRRRAGYALLPGLLRFPEAPRLRALADELYGPAPR